MIMCPVLSLPPDEMRRLGYRAGRPHRRAPRERRRAAADPGRRRGRAAGGARRPAARAARRRRTRRSTPCFDQVLPFVQHPDHPRFFARIGSPSNFIERARRRRRRRASTCSPARGPAAPGRPTVELVVLDWLRELCGLPEGARRRAGERRLGGEPGRARAPHRARGDRAERGRLRLVGGPRVDRRGRCACSACEYAVVPARDDHRLHAEDVRAAIGPTGRRALLRRGDGGHDQHRRRRPARGAGRPRPLAARRRRLRGAGRR